MVGAVGGAVTARNWARCRLGAFIVGLFGSVSQVAVAGANEVLPVEFAQTIERLLAGVHQDPTCVALHGWRDATVAANTVRLFVPGAPNTAVVLRKAADPPFLAADFGEVPTLRAAAPAVESCLRRHLLSVVKNSPWRPFSLPLQAVEQGVPPFRTHRGSEAALALAAGAWAAAAATVALSWSWRRRRAGGSARGPR